MDSYIQQVARDYLFQLSQWDLSPANPYYLFIIYLACFVWLFYVYVYYLNSIIS